MMFRAAKPISAHAALVARRFTSAAMAFSGLVALFHRPKAPLRGRSATLDESPPTPCSSRLKAPESEWEQFVRSIVSMAMREVAEILPGWSIDIHTFESPAVQCYEFVLRAETPPEWSEATRDGDNGQIVPGLPKQEWCATVPVSFMSIHRSRSRAALSQLVSRKLSESAHRICKSARSCARLLL